MEIYAGKYIKEYLTIMILKFFFPKVCFPAGHLSSSKVICVIFYLSLSLS